MEQAAATPATTTETPAPNFAEMSSVSEFRANREQAINPPEPVAATPAAPVPPVESPEQEAESPKPDAEVSEAARTLRKNRAESRKQQIQGEINELIKLRNQLRAEVAQPAQPQQIPAAPPASPAAPQASYPPALVSFDAFAAAHPNAGYEDFLDARTEWKAEQKVQAILAARDAAAEEQQTYQTYAQRAAEYAKQHPDFGDALANAKDIRLYGPAFEALKRHELGPAIAHHLATHRDVAARVTALDPDSQCLAIGELIGTVGRPAAAPAAQTPPPLTRATAPITPIGGSANGPVTRDAKDVNSVTEYRRNLRPSLVGS